MSAADAIATIDDRQFRRMLHAAFTSVAPGRAATSSNLADQAIAVLRALEGADTKKRSWPTDLARASAAIGSIHGQVCTLHDLLQEHGGSTLAKKRAVAAAVATSLVLPIASNVWTTDPQDGWDHVRETGRILIAPLMRGIQQAEDLGHLEATLSKSPALRADIDKGLGMGMGITRDSGLTPHL